MYIERLHGEKLLLRLSTQGVAGFTEFTVETTKRKDKKKVCTKASKGKNQFLYRLIFFF